jgi:hypothetical protein
MKLLCWGLANGVSPKPTELVPSVQLYDWMPIPEKKQPSAQHPDMVKN